MFCGFQSKNFGTATKFKVSKARLSLPFQLPLTPFFVLAPGCNYLQSLNNTDAQCPTPEDLGVKGVGHCLTLHR